MASIRTLCDRALLLDAGRCSFAGPVEETLREYLEKRPTSTTGAQRRPGLSGEVQLDRAWPARTHFEPEQDKRFHFTLRRDLEGSERCFVSVIIRTAGNVAVAHCDSSTVGRWYTVGQGLVEGTMALRTPWLVPGDYHVDIAVCNAGVYDEVDRACSFSVLPAVPYAVVPPPEVLARDLVLPDYGFDLVAAPSAEASSIHAAGDR